LSRKPVPAQSGDRSRVELTFDRPQALSALFGQYDQNLVALENRLGVYITARGNRIGLEGSAEQVAIARDVLNDLYGRIGRGEDVDTGWSTPRSRWRTNRTSTGSSAPTGGPCPVHHDPHAQEDDRPAHARPRRVYARADQP
jgi:phosphate starvation-inducible PhoH-like protein